MRVVSVVSEFPDGATFLLTKFLRLLEHGSDVRMICLFKRKSHTSYEALGRDVKARISFCGQARSHFNAALALPFLFLKSLARNFRGTHRYLDRGWTLFGSDILRRFYLDVEIVCARPDVLHFEFGTLAAGRIYLRELLDTRVVVSFRGYDLNFVGLDQVDYYADVWQQADSLHLLGDDLWRRAQQRGCPSDKRHVLIAPAIDSNFFNPTGLRHNEVVGSETRPLRVLSVGRLVWKKGYEFGLAAIRSLLDQGIDCEYHIIGDGEYFEALTFARHQLGITRQVIFRLQLEPQQVKQEMEWADVFLHPAVSEGFCNAVLEAQSMMLPVVCTNADGLSENVADGETGFVVERRNAKALSEKLAILAHDVELRRVMGTAGRKRVVENFQLVDQVSAFEKLYTNVHSSARHEVELKKLLHKSIFLRSGGAQCL